MGNIEMDGDGWVGFFHGFPWLAQALSRAGDDEVNASVRETQAPLHHSQDSTSSVRFGFGSVGSGSVRFRFVPVPVNSGSDSFFLIEKSILG